MSVVNGYLLFIELQPLITDHALQTVFVLTEKILALTNHNTGTCTILQLSTELIIQKMEKMGFL